MFGIRIEDDEPDWATGKAVQDRLIEVLEEGRTEVDKGKIAAGIKMYAEQLNSNNIFEVINHELHIDCGMVDAEVADAIIQYAIFSEILWIG